MVVPATFPRNDGAMRGSGESYNDVILELVELKGLAGPARVRPPKLSADHRGGLVMTTNPIPKAKTERLIVRERLTARRWSMTAAVMPRVA